jgi:hypothetical protein
VLPLGLKGRSNFVFQSARLKAASFQRGVERKPDGALAAPLPAHS